MAYSLCCVVDWHITNFTSFCSNKNEGFYSEKFVINSLQNSSWFLKCHRKGTGGQTVFALRRSSDVPEQENIHVKFDISLRGNKGISIVKDEPKICDFKVNEEMGYLLFKEQAKISHQAENYFPQDVCRIRCQILKLEEEPASQVRNFFLRTHLPVKNYVFDWSINYVALRSRANKADYRKTLHIVSPVDEEKVFTFSISHYNVDYVRIEFSGDSNNVSKFSWQCNIYTQKTKDNYLTISEDFPALTYASWYKTELMPLKTKEMNCQNPVLTCELSIIFHEVYIPATHVSSKLQSMSCDKTNENDIKLHPKPKTHARSSLKNDIVRMYHEGIMSDFSVKVRDNKIPVHSNILASRSSVFRTMLETNMKEKRDKVLKLDEIDESVVRRFLDYLYTDDLGELTVDLALELYSLGHLYEIEGLKEDSANFLKQNIEISNIGDIIVLSDRHKDEELKSAAVQFIFHNEKEVLLCKEFKDFAKDNAQLSVDIFFKLSEMKLNY